MGDWIPMEIKRREKTLAGLFSKYITLFILSTVLMAGGVFLLLLGLTDWGVVLPANYAELMITENTDKIRKAEGDLEQWIPEGCSYGLYNQAGEWLEGSFDGQDRRAAWENLLKYNIYSGNGSYYRFIDLDDGNICIVKYKLLMRYANSKANDLLPAPELLMPILDVLLFLGNIVLFSRLFANKLKAELRELSGITEKIAANDLEFETGTSDIKEISEVMVSLGQMKDALQDSLKTQWDMEEQKQEQLAALAHDIKTPLTVIRGNAELLEEGELLEENRECAAYILTNVKEIGLYLETMRQVLLGTEETADKRIMNCTELGGMFRETAKQISAAEKIPVCFEISVPEGEIFCNENTMMRAWSNIVSNGAERTDRRKGLEIRITQESREGQAYFKAAVRDYGAGFSHKDLQYADREFYSGDESRHDRQHQGLGLAIAKRFVEEQGGFLEYGNSNGAGAEVALWMLIKQGPQMVNLAIEK